MKKFYVKTPTFERFLEVAEIFEEVGIGFKNGEPAETVYSKFYNCIAYNYSNDHKLGTCYEEWYKSKNMEEVKFENLREVLVLEVKMDNYICINGKKTEFTKEQLQQLGIKVKSGAELLKPNLENNKRTFFISSGQICQESQPEGSIMAAEYGEAFLSKEAAKLALPQDDIGKIFLWIRAYVYNNDDGWRADWGNRMQKKYFIYYDYLPKKWTVKYNTTTRLNGTSMSKEMAEKILGILNGGVK